MDDLKKLAKEGWPCKIGTIPMIVRIHGKDIDKIAPGNYIRVKYQYPTFAGESWSRVHVTKYDPSSRHFFADKFS